MYNNMYSREINLKKNKKLSVKDLVTIGVFAVIYIVLMFAIGMIGIIPILFLAVPFCYGVLLGPLVMLFMAKVQKPWALFIFGIITPLLMFAMGHTYVVFVHGLVVMFIAEMLRRKGKYNSFKYNALANGVFSFWICGSLIQMLLVKDAYLKIVESMMTQDYISQLEKLVTWPNMTIVYASGFIGGIIGAYIGKAMLKKHFKKAGIC